MPMQYVEKWAKGGFHTDSIDSLSFSPDGMILASGGMDGNIVFTSSTQGHQLHIVRCRTPVLALKWVSGRTSCNELWSGFQNGKLLCVTIGRNKLEIFCFTVHKYPIENLSFDHSGTSLATAARHELKIWKCLPSNRLRYINSIPAPRTVTAVVAPHEAILITSLHWLRYGKDAGCLLVTYLYHGIICWDPQSGSSRWTMPLGTLIGGASVHPKEDSIAIMNLSTGVDVWKIPSAIHDFSFDVKLSKGVLIPVTWIDKGARILAGSDAGQVRIWNTLTKNCLPALPHPEQIIRAVAGHYNETHHVFRIATGNAESGAETTLRFFESVELRSGQLRDNTPRFIHRWLLFFAVLGVMLGVLFGLFHIRGYSLEFSILRDFFSLHPSQ